MQVYIKDKVKVNKYTLLDIILIVYILYSIKINKYKQLKSHYYNRKTLIVFFYGSQTSYTFMNTNFSNILGKFFLTFQNKKLKTTKNCKKFFKKNRKLQNVDILLCGNFFYIGNIKTEKTI